MARHGRVTRSCSRTWRARVTWSWRTTPSDRESALSTRQPAPASLRSALGEPASMYSPEYVASSLDFVQEYKRVCGLLAADGRVSLQVTTEQHGYVYEMRRATYAWFNRWFEMKDADDDETSQAVEPDETLFVTPTGF